jgi:hypothetical protein
MDRRTDRQTDTQADMEATLWKAVLLRILGLRVQILFQAVIAFSIYLFIMCCFLSPTWPCDVRTNTGVASNVHIPFILLINARNVCRQHMEFLKCRVKNRLKFSGNIVTVYVHMGDTETHRGHYTVQNTVPPFYVFILKLKSTAVLLWTIHIVICSLCYCTMYLIVLSCT